MTKNLLVIFAFILATNCQARLQVKFDDEALAKDPSIQYGLTELEIATTGSENLTVHLKQDPYLHPEGYEIKKTRDGYSICGGGPSGVMYALLDLRNPSIVDVGRQIVPTFDFRAIKFNLPWDSYRTGEALSLHNETCKDTSFWNSFLDMMASNHFNKLTLWSLHPFNYLVKTTEYPEACEFSDEEMREWELLWKHIFYNAKIRGIETYLINWNIFVPPAFERAHQLGQYNNKHRSHLAVGDTSWMVKDYTRNVVRDVINRYPNLTGLGITLGEGMGQMDPEEREEWLLDTYIQGVREADRKIKFIHRVPLSANKGNGGSTSSHVEKMTRKTLDTLTCFSDVMNIELKFNWSHAYSTPDLMKVHGGKLTDAYWEPFPENYRLAWMMRNEDFFMLRWGQFNFIRQHLYQNKHPYVNGYFIGSECYIPAKDYITPNAKDPDQYAFERQWMYYYMWGRLLFDSESDESIFQQAFEQRYPGNGLALYQAQKQASKIPLMIASFWNARWDFTLYTEGLLSMNDGKVGLMTIEEMIQKTPMDTSFLSVRDPSKSTHKINPSALGDSIIHISKKALLHTGPIDVHGNIDLEYERKDILIWAELGSYFGYKLKAADLLYNYRKNGTVDDIHEAVLNLEMAVDHYEKLVDIAQVYDPVPLMHLTHNKGDDHFHWSRFLPDVHLELEQIKKEADTSQNQSLTCFDLDKITRIKSEMKEGDLDYLLFKADRSIQKGVFSVTQKTTIPPSGDKRDYYSIGPYWWPDPSKSDGLPWINRDGEVNPMNRGPHVDYGVKNDFFESVEILTWAYFFSDDEKYASHLSELLRVWFVDDSTKMNPNLNFAQGIPGRNTGRGIGIIEFTGIEKIITAVEILEMNNQLSADHSRTIRDWFTAFQDWLYSSPYGIDERNKENNHGTWYDVIFLSITQFLGEDQRAITYINEFVLPRIDSQIQPDGKQPHELQRTKAMSYSTMNLRGFMRLCFFGKQLGIDVWNYESPLGGSIPKALLFLEPYAQDDKAWPYQQIKSPNQAREGLRNLLIHAQDDFNLELKSPLKQHSDLNALQKLIR